MPQPLLQLLLVSLASTSLVSANPLLDNLRALDFNELFGRSASCANPCGWSGQLCCSSSQYCYTDTNGQAQCGNNVGGSGGSGYWTTWTSTYVQTDLITVTSVGSSYVGGASVAPAAATPTTAVCDYKLNESPCGSICCASNQYCVTAGQCGAAANPASSIIYASSYSATATTVGFQPPLRPTDSTLITVTSTQTPTITQSFLEPVATGANVTMTKVSQGNHGGLSGGAIAGIVIGVLFGLGLLFLICFCLCLKGLLDGILALFGFGKRNRRRETEREVVEEYHHSSRHGRDDRSYYSGAAGGRGRPARVERKVERRGSGIGKEAVGIAGALAGLAAVLGFKRRQDQKRKERDEVIEKRTYYSEAGGSRVTDMTSESSESSYIRPPPRVRSRSRHAGTVRSASRR
ncbi:hypothetical protein ANO11243_040730 [Dothideomycetidae sp. 11243]|nr:hypothetical protein ANO11243_040730 [fungal sp. No.11243]